MVGSRLVGVAVHRLISGLRVEVRTAAGLSGWAETIDEVEVLDRIAVHGPSMLGRSPWDAGARWRTRPRVGGPEWIAFSVLDTACHDLVARAAGFSLSEWLGGKARESPRRCDETIAAARAGAADFDQVLAELDRDDQPAILVDPRRWGVGAITRLDSWCRVRQVEIGFDLRGSGSLAQVLGHQLAVALPMATLGVRGAEGRAPPGPVPAIEPGERIAALGDVG